MQAQNASELLPMWLSSHIYFVNLFSCHVIQGHPTVIPLNSFIYITLRTCSHLSISSFHEWPATINPSLHLIWLFQFFIQPPLPLHLPSMAEPLPNPSSSCSIIATSTIILN
ncbi:hypothetical protein KSP39_PZI002185 [Platanthera zijinensis]|uniref:Uncharacterized protein n=1 Tax=Platanthera zijinensis TaxID=2320716 RepID=A0AAP0GED0_9ASPA